MARTKLFFFLDHNWFPVGQWLQSYSDGWFSDSVRGASARVPHQPGRGGGRLATLVERAITMYCPHTIPSASYHRAAFYRCLAEGYIFSAVVVATRRVPGVQHRLLTLLLVVPELPVPRREDHHNRKGIVLQGLINLLSYSTLTLARVVS